MKPIKIRESGVHTFQIINEDGSNAVTYNYNSDGQPVSINDYGIRIIAKRLNELKQHT